MIITHNRINDGIRLMLDILGKGQPFASRNKERRIRLVLWGMIKQQNKPILFKEVWFYFWRWLKSKFKKKEKDNG